MEIRWPNVVRIETVVRPNPSDRLDPGRTAELDPARIPIAAELAPALGGRRSVQAEKIDLEKIPESFRPSD